MGDFLGNYTHTGNDFTGSDIGMLFLIAVVSTLLLGSTFLDLYLKIKKRVADKHGKYALMTSFSLQKNGNTLLNTRTTADTITCLFGLRFLSMAWIILGHTFYMKAISPSVNQEAIIEYDPNASSMLLLNATVSTDTFLLLSGTLLSHIFLRKWNDRPTLNVYKFYLLRYIRLTPPYAFVIFFYATLMYHLGSGPLWDVQVGYNKQLCMENWWTNLLYLNNYINVDKMCMNQTWYLAVDMQLFWFSPIFLYTLVKWPRYGRMLLGFGIATSIIIPFAITLALGLPPAMLYTKDEEGLGKVYVQIYTRTYARAGPYLIGISLGYLLHKWKKNIKLDKKYVALGWLGSLIICLSVLLGVAVFYDSEHGYNAFESSVYAALHRSAWALGVAWVIFACAKGYGDPVNKFLSWKFFFPLSRLTYCAYLCHYIVLLYNIGSMKIRIYVTGYSVLQEFWANLIFSFLLATIVYLAFEEPFRNLSFALLRKSPDVFEKERRDSERKYNDNILIGKNKTSPYV
ncbi:Nose resistant to fluoxetine protein 6 [Blattella germanica]|nr:Nose resistant to fluoxetine protein 6 [Blattella germanica]